MVVVAKGFVATPLVVVAVGAVQKQGLVFSLYIIN